MTQLGVLSDEHRYQKAVTCLESGIGLDIDHGDRQAEFARYRCERGVHLFAEMAVGSMVEGEIHASECSKRRRGANDRV